MSRAIVVREYGGPEQLQLETAVVGNPGSGQVRLRQTAVGVNFHDCYVRSGLYKTLALPGTPGVEAAGVIEAVGLDVKGFSVGDRVGYVSNEYGAYAESRLIEADRLIRLRASIDDATAAAVLVKGLTALMLLTKLRPVGKGDTVLVHAAAGGVGQLLCQWAAHRGVRVIGTAGSAEKATIAKARGCTDVILYKERDFVGAVKDITGSGVDVAYDSVGKDTFDGSLECLALRGVLVNFGQSSGPVAPLAPARLAAKSNAVWRPILFHYIVTRDERQAMADELFAAIAAGTLTIDIGARLPLSEAAEAHRALERRATTGSTILTV